jgi:alpha-amylase/alpha-mannosidase (GH57 family)
MPRYVCLHGHFYQPPRDNPWRPGVIEPQPSAAPFADWNARVTAECYAPNARAKVGDRQVNNYARVSFDFGPTLLDWLETHAPETYAAVLDADRQSCARFSGHGGAMAQAYNHTILPLATAADKRTQIAWGLDDFRRRFRREAEGMWLPECAVDVPTLEALADARVRFTVLAPQSLRAVRRMGDDAWHAPDAQAWNRAYAVLLPSGRSMYVFFYNGEIAQAVAFNRLLDDGGTLVKRLAAAATDGGLVHIATDGESYGHHHRFGEMALAYALETIDRGGELRLTTYGEYLSLAPPEWEAQINEPTSWSCEHGVERWRSDCGCRGGRYEGSKQAWRAPLRRALDELRVALEPVADPRVARFAQLMFTSCGWFFDEPSDLETAQILAYAARAIELAKIPGLRARFLARLGEVKSNFAQWGDARRVFEVTEAEQSFAVRVADGADAATLLALAEKLGPSFDLRRALVDTLRAKVAGAAVAKPATEAT